MKNKIILKIAIVAILLLGVLFYLSSASNRKEKTFIQKIGDEGLFVGEEKKAPNTPTDFSSQYDEQVKAVHGAWENIRLGDSYSKSGNYEDASEAYKKAYVIGEKAVSGLLLAMTYEKLHRHDDGIILLNQMIQNGELSEKGIQNANEIKSRLLAAKTQSDNSNTRTSGTLRWPNNLHDGASWPNPIKPRKVSQIKKKIKKDFFGWTDDQKPLDTYKIFDRVEEAVVLRSTQRSVR